MVNFPMDDASIDSPSNPPVADRPILPAWLEASQESRTNPYLPPPPVDSLTPAQKTGSTALLIGVIFMVGLGMIAFAPGLGILMAILFVPPLVRTLVVVQHRNRQQRPPNSAEQLLLFFGSFGVTIVVSLVVLVSAFGTFCFVCLSAGTERAIPVAAVAAIAAAIATSVPLFFWVRSRWRRHTQST